MPFSRIVVTGDILRVDAPTSLDSAQRLNVEWIYRLFGPLVEGELGVRCELVYGTGQQRLRWYTDLDVPFSPEGWAAIYDDIHNEEIENYFAELYAGALVIGYETPPYLVKVLDKAGIAFIDLSIHPVRYLTDYLFGVRSNDCEIMSRIEAASVPEKLFRDFARISLARSVRVWDKDVVSQSALFIGQVEIDSTLLTAGRIAGTDEVEMALLQLLTDYPFVYYKFHPHRREKESVTRMIGSINRCEIIELNIYDAFYSKEFALFASLSSGSLVEADLFGRPTRRFLMKPSMRITGGPLREAVAASPAIFCSDYWRFLIFGEGHPASFLPHLPMLENPLKYSLNFKWGR